MARIPSKSPSKEYDPLVPLGKVDDVESDCFGLLWDVTTRECSSCADRDICGIVFGDELEKRANAVQENNGSIFLDVQNFEAVANDDILSGIDSGTTTVADLVDYVAVLANTSDTKAVVTFLKRWITSQNSVYTKNGIVWIR